ncbi:MAG: ATP-dependent helicase HrpB [Hyphomicrobiaceae bacterium]
MHDRTGLPIDDVLPRVTEVLAGANRAVLVAPPGAGKTTIVPLALINLDWMAGKRLLVLEPRRIAARAAAARMAHLIEEDIGETVGVRARLSTNVGPESRIEVITEGVFTRMIIDDPSLEGVGAVLFDEFHERSLDGDFGLALALEAQAALREDLRLVIMSATIDGGRLASVLGDVPIVTSDGRAFPVETRYLGRPAGGSVVQAVCDAVLSALRKDAGSVLVFLPGQGEIRRTADLLCDRLDDASVRVAPLYGAMSAKDQDRAIRPSPDGLRKVVLATAIAETSLTIEGVRIVIDAGLARVPRYDAEAQLARLETVRVSRASADQRRGRAGRTETGICYRLWSEAETQGLRPFETPEIQVGDLTGLVLDCAAWGIADPAQLDWVDAPSEGSLAAARDMLRNLDALDNRGHITGHGKALRKLPMPPHLAGMLLRASTSGQAELAAELAALLVERGIGNRSTDIEDGLHVFRADRSRRAGQLRSLASQWARAATSLAGEFVTSDRSRWSVGQLLALAFPGRIARRRGATERYLMVNGRGARLLDDDALGTAEFLVICDLTGSAGAARILSAARLTREEVESVAGNRIEAASRIHFDLPSRAVRASAVRRLGAIILQREALAVPRDERTATELARGIAEEVGVAQLPWSKAQKQLRARIGWLHGSDPSWPDVSDDGLRASWRTWLAPFLIGKAALTDISAADLTAMVDSLLPQNLKRQINSATPTHFVAPSGHRHPIDYEGEHAPAVALRVQEFYGTKTHPMVADGRLPLTLILLSPAGRPIQVTRDLPGFWAGSWRDVRAEMRGRYPKHIWPEDPANAAATTRAKPRRE